METRVLRQHSDVQTSKHLDLSESGGLCRVSAAAAAAAAARVPLILLSSGLPLRPFLSSSTLVGPKISSQKPVGSFSPRSFSLSLCLGVSDTM